MLLAAAQLLLPLRHYAYPGNVRFTEEGYYLSWRVMLTEKAGHAEFSVTDGATGRSWQVGPELVLTDWQAAQASIRPDLLHAAASRGSGNQALAPSKRWVSKRHGTVSAVGVSLACFLRNAPKEIVGICRRRQANVRTRCAASCWRVLRIMLWPILLTLLGVVTVSCSISISGSDASYIATHLYAFEDETVQLEGDAGTGGAIEIFGEDLLVVAPHGRIALVHRNGNAEFLDGQVPMNLAAIESHLGAEDPNLLLRRFRVADVLLKKLEEGYYELFATHHYFTGECFRFRLSATTIVEDETNITVRPEWRTIFDFEPCFTLSYFSGTQAGGKMLTDGPDHLLLTAGVHKRDQHPAFPDAKYLGKVLRLEIQTGEVEVLAEGLRNSQGLVRDADGNLWATDHGPTGGDELNLLQAGGNYGWPHVTYGIHNNNRVPEEMEYNDVGQHDGFLRPVHAWIPSPAISAIAVNDEQQLPLWKDDLLVTSLKDQSLFRIRRHGTDVKYFERIELGYRIRDIAIMPDGRIALFNGEEMRIHFLSRSLRFCDEKSRERRYVYSADCDSVSASP